MHSSLSLKCPLKYIFNRSPLKYFFPFWVVLKWILECCFSGLNVGKSQLLRQKVNLGGDNERVGTPLKSGRCLITLYHYKGSRGWAAEMGPWAEWIFKAHVQWHSSSDNASSPHFQTQTQGPMEDISHWKHSRYQLVVPSASVVLIVTGLRRDSSLRWKFYCEVIQSLGTIDLLKSFPMRLGS